ncbi:hypothetical protein ACFOYW_13360 [Gryllotalpicola reticulitermitis]|uniref:Uncharacterized protein n=1 Tax=Gryllotalpicola reticulitermitis TaxID=1184153 RepID=A0ABV8QA86_9MICO
MEAQQPQHRKEPFVSEPETSLSLAMEWPPRTRFRCACGFEVIAPDRAEGAAVMQEHITPGMGGVARSAYMD